MTLGTATGLFIYVKRTSGIANGHSIDVKLTLGMAHGLFQLGQIDFWDCKW